MRRRKKEAPLVENIADYADMGYEEEFDVLKETASKDASEEEDETDRMWMYEDDTLLNIQSIQQEEEEEKEEKETKQTQKEQQKEIEKIKAKKEEKKENMMNAAAWFRDMGKAGQMTDDEKRYVELMLIELPKFYFLNLENNPPSQKCKEAIKNICKSITEAGLCTAS